MIEIYADGACRNNQQRENIGGYGAVIINEDMLEINGIELNTTNNRMELLSIIKALETLTVFDKHVKVYMDSQYVVSTINLQWSMKVNLDLWEKLFILISKFKHITFHKVKAHANNIYNNLADELANIAMDNYLKTH